MINYAGKINITHLAQLGYKPGRLIDIWETKYGRQATGNCFCCQAIIHPMRIMRKCGKIQGCYPSSAECFIVINIDAYPGLERMKILSHKQRASIAELVCQSCWISLAANTNSLYASN